MPTTVADKQLTKNEPNNSFKRLLLRTEAISLFSVETTATIIPTEAKLENEIKKTRA